jgi:hypothetical protein
MGRKPAFAASLAGSVAGDATYNRGHFGKKIKHRPIKHAFQTEISEKKAMRACKLIPDYRPHGGLGTIFVLHYPQSQSYDKCG